ncbi:MAG TPA: hypothetical protein VLJ83_06450, partial [Gemmatimonadaceae bacterium]|nr:hypothetical protein [Gemmatimonadaceae bacterium]
ARALDQPAQLRPDRAGGQKILAAGQARRVEKLSAAVARLTRGELRELRRGSDLLERVVVSMREGTAN